MGNAVGTPPRGPDALPRHQSTTENISARQYLTLPQLATFNGGEDGKDPIYIAIRSDVYDVSLSRELYGPSGKYKALAGKDVTRAIALGKLCDENELDTLDLSDLTLEHFQNLDKWLANFDHKDDNVGRLVDTDLQLTLDQLRCFNGVDNPRQTILLAVDGVLYDVTMNGAEFYGSDGMYSRFAGRDVSKALACMSLEEEDFDKPSINE